MMLDDVYGSDLDERIVRQEAVWRDRVLPELEWDEREASLVVEEVLGGSQRRSYVYS